MVSICSLTFHTYLGATMLETHLCMLSVISRGRRFTLLCVLRVPVSIFPCMACMLKRGIVVRTLQQQKKRHIYIHAAKTKNMLLKRYTPHAYIIDATEHPKQASYLKARHSLPVLVRDRLLAWPWLLPLVVTNTHPRTHASLHARASKARREQ